MLRVRRGLIEQIQDTMKACQLFQRTQTYPKRYYDDLMLAESKSQKTIEDIQKRISPDRDAMDKLDDKLAQVGVSRLSKAMVTETGYSSLEPSSRLNVNSSHFLPELRNENKTESKL